MLRRTLCPALIALALGLASVVPAAASSNPASSNPASSDPGAPTCDGRPATIVAEPGSTAQGTSGDDVIVSNGAQKVDGGAGDDTICVTGGTFYAFDGPGDDVIDARLNPVEGLVVHLTEGDDTFLGGVAGETVEETGGGADTVLTGGGKDLVLHSGTADVAPDVIDLGKGRDVLLADDVPPGSMLAGGAGKDEIEAPDDHGGTPGHWVYDVTDGVFRNGSRVAEWSGFDVYHLDADLVGSAVFRGDDHRQIVRPFGSAPVRLHLGGGDDVVATAFDNPALVVDGGPGRDTFEALADDDGNPPGLLADLPARAVSSVDYGHHTRTTIHVSHLEDVLAVRFFRALLIGDAGPNRLRLVDVCGTAVAEGGGGDDVLRSDRDADADRGCHGSRLSGGPGDDALVGDGARDVLVGGSGRDVARGRDGVDRCVAEVRTGCE